MSENNETGGGGAAGGPLKPPIPTPTLTPMTPAMPTTTQPSQMEQIGNAMTAKLVPLMISAQDSCIFRGMMSAVMGGAMGFAFGAVMAPLEAPSQEQQAMKLKDQLRVGFKQTMVKSSSWAKNFALLGGVYATSECALQKFRAKSDLYNGAMAGCFTGGILAAKAGPQAAAIGCATFAAFSVAIDHFFHG